MNNDDLKNAKSDINVLNPNFFVNDFFAKAMEKPEIKITPKFNTDESILSVKFSGELS